MSWLSRMAATAGRATARLVPPSRRDWAEAVWAEAHEVPAGWQRLAWRAGGVRLIAKEALIMRRTGSLLLFAAAAGAAAWGAWPGSPAGHAAEAQADVIVTVLLLAGLPLLTRWFLGPPDNRAARWLRAGCYAAILALLPAKTVTGQFAGAVPLRGIDLRIYDAFQGHGVPGASSGGAYWPGEIAILLLTACYLAVILALTARRAAVAPATLAAGAGAGLVLGVVMYTVAPLGLGNDATNPWLRGSATDPLVALAWILLFGAPLTAGAFAGRRCYVSGSPGQVSAARAWQGLAAGLVSNAVGAVVVTVLGSGTTALLVKAAWARSWLYYGQHLTASALYGRELTASENVIFYFAICVCFPIIGFLMGLAGAGYANVTGPLPDCGRPSCPPGPPGPEPVPDPPDRGRRLDAGADLDTLLDLYDSAGPAAPG